MTSLPELKGKIADFTILLKEGPMSGRPFVEAFTTASEIEDSEASFFPEFLEDFRVETASILVKIRSAVEMLAVNPKMEHAHLAEAFRVCHMLKGSAATMGFNRLSYLAHGLERVFEDLKEKRIEVTPDIVSVTQMGFALVEETVQTMKA